MAIQFSLESGLSEAQKKQLLLEGNLIKSQNQLAKAAVQTESYIRSIEDSQIKIQNLESEKRNLQQEITESHKRLVEFSKHENQRASKNLDKVIQRKKSSLIQYQNEIEQLQTKLAQQEKDLLSQKNSESKIRNQYNEALKEISKLEKDKQYLSKVKKDFETEKVSSEISSLSLDRKLQETRNQLEEKLQSEQARQSLLNKLSNMLLTQKDRIVELTDQVRQFENLKVQTQDELNQLKFEKTKQSEQFDTSQLFYTRFTSNIP